jgi:hypothetical protein
MIRAPEHCPLHRSNRREHRPFPAAAGFGSSQVGRFQFLPTVMTRNWFPRQSRPGIERAGPVKPERPDRAASVRRRCARLSTSNGTSPAHRVYSAFPAANGRYLGRYDVADITVIPIGPDAVEVQCGDQKIKVRLPPGSGGAGGQGTAPSGPATPPAPQPDAGGSGGGDPDPIPEYIFIPPYIPIPLLAFRGVSGSPVQWQDVVYTQAKTADQLYAIGPMFAERINAASLASDVRLVVQMHSHSFDMGRLARSFEMVDHSIKVIVYVGVIHG